MYLSRLKLGKSTKCRAVRFSVTKLHGIIERCFEGEKDRVLWRIDRVGVDDFVLILSERKPSLINAAEQLCDFGQTIEESKSYDKTLEKINTGDVYRFRLRANPVIKYGNKIEAIASPNEHTAEDIKNGASPNTQRNWLTSRAASLGFSLRGDDFLVVKTEWVKVIKQGNKPFSFKSAEYEGVLTVTDAELFRQTMMRGIGREKAYGCGLLTVIKL
ncbi:MAG: type I-E CRISPR-associated protein Cas6/Cse3/CasE [Ruminococcus sp.]|jgi:CRISPR system Cascade subunit CasE|nr:type I-E CRISPR-associated protein Cas6/Cse3/CasE [Ruminococcus sp.]